MPTVAALGEVGVIARLRRQIPGVPSVLVGIGDDAAVLRGGGREHTLFASDMLVEGVHFRLPTKRGLTPFSTFSRGLTPPRWIGWKALAVNVSDIAAMGGLPTHAVVSLGLPRTTPVAFVDGLYQGLTRCARRFGMSLVGGDTVRAPVVVVDVAILGRVKPEHLVLRSGAAVGDRVFVTGRLGGSLASGRHATFVPRLTQAQWLVRRLPVHAMMDLSDGLASDLWQLARASRVAFQIEARAIPVSRAGKTVRHALMDGEDFELVFAVSPQTARRVPSSIGRVPVTEIGVVSRRGARVELMDAHGRITPLIPTGFRHF